RPGEPRRRHRLRVPRPPDSTRRVRRLASQRVRATGGTAWTSLVEDLRPRVRELRYSIHLLRRSLLAMVGLGIVLFFLVLAVTGPLLAPYRFLYNDAEKNVPPLTPATVSLTKTALDMAVVRGRRTEMLATRPGVHGPA